MSSKQGNGPQVGEILFSTGYLAMLQDIFGFHNWRNPTITSGYRPGSFYTLWNAQDSPHNKEVSGSKFK